MMDKLDKTDIEVEFLDAVRKKNAPGYVAGKMMIGFSLIFAAALLLGFLFYRSSKIVVAESMKLQITAFFTDAFSACDSADDWFSVILTTSVSDIRNLLLICTSGFTFFCKFACGALVATRAFSLGFTLEYLILAVGDGKLVIPHPVISIFIFSLCKIIIAALFVYLSVKATVFGDDFRRLRGRKSLLLRSPIIYRYFFLFLTAFGLVITVNAVLCLLSSIIK